MTETTIADGTKSSGTDLPVKKTSDTASEILFDDVFTFRQQPPSAALPKSTDLGTILPTGTVGSDGGLTFTVPQNPDILPVEQFIEPGDEDPNKGVVSKNASGKVTQVTYPNGKSRNFGYDEHGDLKTIKQPDGTFFQLQDGRWTSQTSMKVGGGLEPGKNKTIANQELPSPKSSAQEILNPKIADDGTFSYGTPDGQHISVTGDGVQTTQHDWDKSTVTSDANDRVTKIEYADGRIRQFEYGSKGTLLNYSDVDGTTYSLKDGKYVDASGKDSGLNDIVPSTNGDVAFTKDGKSIVVHTNYSRSITNENSSLTTEDANGILTSVTYGNKQTRTFTFEDGVLSTFSDADGHVYTYNNGKWLNDHGEDSRFSQVKVDKDGGLSYLDQEHHVVTAGTDGTVSATTQTLEQLQETSKTVRAAELNKDSAAALQALDGMTVADRLVLQKEYEKQFCSKLTDDLSTNLLDVSGRKAYSLLLEANLDDDARKYLSDTLGPDGKTERERFLDNIQTFKTRATQEGFSDAQTASLFESIEQLFDAPEGKVSEQWRHNLAAQIMGQAANPDTADQGYHGTCQMTVVEGRTWWRHPEIAAGMISQIAIEGQWTSYDGKIITIPDGGLVPDGEARIYPKTDVYRSFASQIFQVGVFNDWGQRDNPPRWYTLQRPEGDGAADDGWLSSRDSTDLLRDKDGSVAKPAFGFAEIGLYGQLLAGSDGKTTLMNAQYGYEDCSTVGTFRDEDELGRIIEENQRRGNMPIAIGVAASDHTVFGGDQNRSDPGHQVDHVILIDDYDPQTGMVKLNNSWGPDGDKWVKLEDLYYATGRFDEPSRTGGAW